jgi:hypothetical protein
VAATARIADRLKNSIGLMCSPSYNSKYVPHKDVSLPQSVQPYAYTEARNIEKNRQPLFLNPMNSVIPGTLLPQS